MIENTKQEIIKIASRIFFVKGVTDEKIIINKKSKTQIVQQLEKFPNIIIQEGNYDYLLRMPLYSLTKEKIAELIGQMKDKKFLLDEYKAKEPKTFWLEDLTILKSHI